MWFTTSQDFQIVREVHLQARIHPVVIENIQTKMLFRPQSFAAVFILVSIIYASSQDVISKLSSNSELSSFTSMVKNSTALQKALNSTHDFTLLAPSNAALAAAANHTASLNQNQTDALLVYHLLNSTVPFASFQTKPKFIPTFLTSSE